MLTGDIDPTDGMAEINGFSILNELGDARRNIGYCPQFDALHPLLTGILCFFFIILEYSFFAFVLCRKSHSYQHITRCIYFRP
jgi:hypothetical protein